ncbi:MAG: hypothetical protein HPY66_2899 [Firmicutes bacterium]|nr:hypothetical protein [Bacillota bacterium]MDI6705348.1 hypothetical protein [Bacillota bacterium]
MKYNENYKLLPSQIAQQVMKSVNEEFKSFFELIHKKRSGQYTAKASIPHYLPKDGVREITFTPAHFKIIQNQIRLSLPKQIKIKYNVKYLYFPIPPHIIDQPVKEVQIQPYYG